MSHPEATSAPPDDEPVLATIVPPAPTRWQFGLKSLFGLIVACSVLFALMSYLKVFWGLLAAVGLCFVALAVLLLWAVLFVPSRSSLMERLDYFGIRLVVGIAILFVGTILAGGGTAVYDSVNRTWMAMELESDFGIRTMRSEVWDGKQTYRALKIVVVFPGSYASKVGIQPGEVIVIPGTIDQFYENLEQKRGQSMDIDIAAPPVGGSIEKSPPRRISITVPK
jgi:hypothetical protein